MKSKKDFNSLELIQAKVNDHGLILDPKIKKSL